MSRSYRKTPIMGMTTAHTEAWDKQDWHSRFRSNTKQNINKCQDFDNFVDVNFREVSNVWNMAKDGRQRMDVVAHPYLKKYLRK